MNVIANTICGSLAFVALVSTASAQVTYTATDVSGSTWQYTYSISNNFPTNSVEEFTIYSPVGQYSNLSVVSSPSTWSSIVVQPDSNLPAAGFFDSVALKSGLSTGKSQGGFTERFTWLGKGTPGPQSFDIVNATTFSTIFSGVTVASIHAPEIDPASGAAALTFLFGCIAVLRGRRPKTLS